MKRKKNIINLVFCVVIVLSGNISFSQVSTWNWAKSFGSLDSESPQRIAVDSSGNVFTLGQFNSPTVSFDNITLTNTTWTSSFIMKQNTNGDVQWVNKISSRLNPQCVGICTNKNGDFFVAGSFYDSISFGNGVSLYNIGNFDFFIAKYTSNGELLWTKTNNSSNLTTYLYDIITDNNGNILITGNFISPTITFDITVLTNNSVSGKGDSYVAKYDSLGNFLWVKNIFGTEDESAKRVITDMQGNVYVAGSFNSPTINFSTTTLNNSTPNTPSSNIFFAKYDASGSLIWAKSASASDGIGLNDIAINSNGIIYASGSFTGATATFDGFVINGNGSCQNTFIISFNENYVIQWTKSFGYQNNNNCAAVTIDKMDNVYISGSFFQTLNIDGHNLSVLGWGDIYVAKYDQFGVNVDVLTCGGSKYENVIGMKADADGNCYLVGDFSSNPLAFGSINLQKDTTTYYDIFTAKLSFKASGIKEIEKNNVFKIYPNPMENQSIIRFIEEQKMTEINIIDVSGQLIKTYNFSGKELIIEKENIKSGLYFVGISGNKSEQFVKLLID